MMRNKTPSSMQKTYDDCYLICSTAVYFEGQNNEAEALRSWRSALDQIYYHNAYRVPPNYQPKTETEKALHESLRDMELQCKERVDLLEAIRQSRLEIKRSEETPPARFDVSSKPAASRKMNSGPSPKPSTSWQPPPTVGYSESPKYPPPPLPSRPALLQKKSSQSLIERSQSSAQITAPGLPMPYPPPKLPVPTKQISRTPSPEKKGRMLTTLRGTKDARKSKSPKASHGHKSRPPVASKAAGLAWDSLSRSSRKRLDQGLPGQNGVAANLESSSRSSHSDYSASRRSSDARPDENVLTLASYSSKPQALPVDPSSFSSRGKTRPNSYHADQVAFHQQRKRSIPNFPKEINLDVKRQQPPSPLSPPLRRNDDDLTKTRARSPGRPKLSTDYLSYRNEYSQTTSSAKLAAQYNAVKTSRQNEDAKPTKLSAKERSPQRKPQHPQNDISRRPVPNTSSPRSGVKPPREPSKPDTSDSADEHTDSADEPPQDGNLAEQNKRIENTRKHLPKGVDEHAAKQIFNDIVVRGDEVHWDDVAGLDIAKKALKEAVVYPFLRPDLFMGLREPARGMLLFGPPGTGKTMLARAVATESRSTFFSISASSLTSKWLGESEKLVRALFSLARALAPSIIFVDEIDSLLSSRGGSTEHESTRRIKTEFLIQWSDLQRAAAGKLQSEKEKQEGDASRVLVLAATNLPWAIDEAARRRFVRRQYIPLPEAHVRAVQLRTLLGHQKHNLDEENIQGLVELTDGFSGSDITALAKDAAMGPLRSLGEALLHMSMDEIRPIQFEDFVASLVNIRPSVSKQGLQEFEDWAKEFGERGG